MKQNHPLAMLFLPVLLMLSFIACRHDHMEDPDSPGYHISQSEKLQIPAAIALPANAPGGNARVATYYAIGVQKYTARLKAGGTTGYEWKFIAPQAILYDANNHVVGTHSAGPTWQLTGGTDSIHGQAFVPAKIAPDPAGSAIDWLQLMPKTGNTATGIFANVSYIQRIATTGGKAPAAAPVNGNETADVPYTAVYRFSRQN